MFTIHCSVQNDVTQMNKRIDTDNSMVVTQREVSRVRMKKVKG